MKKLILLVVVLASNFCVYSQSGGIFYDQTGRYPKILEMDLIKPAPTGAGLIRFLDYPVSNATGIPEINIPIYTIKSGSLELPITISYHAGGVKVDDEAGEIGLGWILSAGGSVTKSIKGSPDDKFVREGGWLVKSRNEIIAENDKNYLYAIGYTGDNDTQHDQYYYDCGGAKGSFIYDFARRKISQIPVSDNRIEIVRGVKGIQSITITNNKGEIYKYEMADTMEYSRATTSAVIHPANTGVITSNAPGGSYFKTVPKWLLTKIISADRADSITFAYERGAYWESASHTKALVVDDRVSYTTTAFEDRQMVHPDGIAVEDQNLGLHTVHQNTNMVAYKYTYSWKLKTIRFNGGVVEFTNTADRSDQTTPERVARIHVNATDAVQTTVFSQDYFSCGRMKLSGLETYGRNHRIIDKYRFDYYEQYRMPRKPQKLHEINSTSIIREPYYGQDLFGYYNGIDDNPYLAVHDEVYAIKPNRRYSFEHAQNLSLKRITGITGGYTEFTYESNQPQSGPAIGIRTKNIAVYDSSNSLINKKSFTYAQAHLPDIESDNINNYAHVSHTPFHEMVLRGASICPEHGVVDGMIIKRIHYKKTTSYSPTTVVPGASYETSIITYGEVTETLEDHIGNKFKTVFNYSDDPSVTDWSRFVMTSHFIPQITDNSYTNTVYMPIDRYLVKEPCSMNLTKKTTYLYKDGVYRKDEETANTYQTYDKAMIHGGLYVQLMGLNDVSGVVSNGVGEYYLFDIQVPTCRKQLVKSVHTKFYDNGEATQTTLFTYATNPDQTLKNGNVKTIKHITPTKTYENRFFYPADYTTPVHRLMVDNNMNPIIRNDYYIDDQLVRSLNNTYSIIEYPDKRKMIFPTDIALLVDNQRIEYKTISRYTKSGRIGCTLSHDTPPTVYLWGYNAQYPVARIENATYDEVVSVLSEYTIEAIEGQNFPVAAQQASLNGLRTRLPHSQVTTYTYLPMIGISSITDPSGRVTYYEYDDANRLKCSRDEKRNILEAYDYNYINQ